MSRRSRAGTAEKPPSVEETLGRLEVKLKELELKYELREKELLLQMHATCQKHTPVECAFFGLSCSPSQTPMMAHM